MAEQYKVEWVSSINRQPRIEKYFENGEQVDPPIPTDEDGKRLLGETKELMYKLGLENLTVTAKKLKD